MESNLITQIDRQDAEVVGTMVTDTSNDFEERQSILFERIGETCSDLTSDSFRDELLRLEDLLVNHRFVYNDEFFSRQIIEFVLQVALKEIPRDTLVCILRILIMFIKEKSIIQNLIDAGVYDVLQQLFTNYPDLAIKSYTIGILADILYHSQIRNQFLEAVSLEFFLNLMDTNADLKIMAVAVHFIAQIIYDLPLDYLEPICYQLTLMLPRLDKDATYQALGTIFRIFMKYPELKIPSKPQFEPFFMYLHQSEFNIDDPDEKIRNIANVKLNILIFTYGKKIFEYVSLNDYINFMLHPNFRKMTSGGHSLSALFEYLTNDGRDGIPDEKLHELEQTRLPELLSVTFAEGRTDEKYFAFMLLGTLISNMTIPQVIEFVQEDWIDQLIDFIDIDSIEEFLLLISTGIFQILVLSETSNGITRTARKLVESGLYESFKELSMTDKNFNNAAIVLLKAIEDTMNSITD